MKRQDHPSSKVQDLGIEMTWGKPGHSIRLYRNLRDHAPYAFWFDDVVVHDHDIVGSIEYQDHLARETAVGKFFPLSACLLALYADNRVDRNIFSVLAELDRMLPPDRHVTAEDNFNFCHSLGKAAPLPPGPPPPDPATGMLATDLEMHGFRLTKDIKFEGRALVGIDWLPKPGGRLFFAGVLEFRPTQNGIVGQWMLPGPSGVNQLLRKEIEKLCEGPSAVLTPAGRRLCLQGIKPLPQVRNVAQHISTWKPELLITLPAKSSSSQSPRRNKLS